jgi:predicted outer membrane repeat protein
VTINAPGAAFAIDGQNAFRGLTIGNVPVSISGVTVQNAQSFGNIPGGGIVSEGNLTLNNVNVFSSVSGGLGGGVSTTGSIVTTGGIYRGNFSSMSGGAIYAGGNLSLTNTEITLNNAQAHGGGVYAVGTVEINGGAFLSNTAALYGGGIAINEAALLANVLFQNNRSVTRAGGGITLLDYVPATFTNVNFIANIADEDGGGGLAAVGPGGPASAPDLLFNGGRFERNRALLNVGGGIKANNVILTNTLFITNSAFSGAGAHLLRVVATGGSFEGESRRRLGREQHQPKRHTVRQ